VVVDVLAILSVGGEAAPPKGYDVLIRVDGEEHTLHLVHTGGRGKIDILDYTDKLYWDLFAEDHFYIAAVPRLLRDIEGGDKVSFPLRLIESGPGARYRKDEQP